MTITLQMVTSIPGMHISRWRAAKSLHTALSRPVEAAFEATHL